jgi:hypothetical protein
MKKLILVLSTFIVSFSSIAAITTDNVMSQDTTNNSKVGRRTGIGTLGIGSDSLNMNQDTMNRSRTGGKMSKMDRDMNKGTMKDQKMGGKNGKMQGMSSDGIMMKDGKMMITQNGKTTAMENEMTLENGTRVMTDGTYMDKNGSTMRMKNGDHMMMSGKMMSMKKLKMK